MDLELLPNTCVWCFEYDIPRFLVLPVVNDIYISPVYLWKNKILIMCRVHGVAVCDDAIYFHNHCNTLLAQVGLTDIRSEDILNIIEGAKGLGYGLSQQPELGRPIYKLSHRHTSLSNSVVDFVSEIAMSTGIVLDPVYTGKAVLGFLNQLKANSSVFKGKRILYIHTGSNEGIVLWFSMLVDCRWNFWSVRWSVE